jgi:hypothetical protein
MPSTLLIREEIRGLSLDKLDSLIVTFTQEQEAAVKLLEI